MPELQKPPEFDASQLAAIVESSDDAIVSLSLDGAVVTWNPAAVKMFGYQPSEIVGQSISILRPADRPGETRYLLHRVKNEPVRGFETERLHKDGTPIPVALSISLLRDASGKLTGFCGILRDITERKQSERQLRRKQRSLEALLESLERERRLTTFEIHDGAVQQVAAALMHFEGDAAIRNRPDGQKGIELLRTSLAELRRIMHGLRPAVLEAQGLVAGIQRLVDELPSCIQAAFESDVQFKRLSGLTENCIFRIAQEALNNVAKYSRADRVAVELTQRGKILQLMIQDWGIGFDTTPGEDGHFGLRGIEERAAILGGSATIRSTPGEGTRVEVQIPLE